MYAFDPGDMRTEMHQPAFPGEDISDRPEPETVVPALLRLLDERPPSGRYRRPNCAAWRRAMTAGRGQADRTGAAGRPRRPCTFDAGVRSSDEPPEARGTPATAYGCWSPADARRARAFRGPAGAPGAGDLVVVNTSATLAAALDGPAATARPSRCTSRRALPDGGWASSCGPAHGPRTGARRGRASSSTCAMAALRAARGLPRPAGARRRLWQAPVACRSTCRRYLARHGAPIPTTTCPGPGRWRAIRRSSRRSRAARRCRAPARPFTARVGHRARGRRASQSRRSRCTPASRRWRRASRRCRSATGCRRRPRGWST